MKTFALTGGIGMGKSTVADWLRAEGAAVVDTDVLARDLVQPGQPALGEIEAAFGPGLIAPDGCLRREALAHIVFADPGARRRLEAVLHPRIHEAWRAELWRWRREGQPRAVVVIPLLFEIGAEAEFDRTVCVACSAATCRARLLARGWDDTQIRQRVAAQLPLREKMIRAQRVIWNEGTLGVLAEQARRCFA